MAAGTDRSRLRAARDLFIRAFRDDPAPDEAPASMLPSRYKVYRGLVSLIVVNFVVFVVIAHVIGGDAWNGKQQDGHYFVWGSKGFGPKTLHEVSRTLFRYSWWHVVSIMVTWPVAMLLGWRLHRITQAAQAQWDRTRRR